MNRNNFNFRIHTLGTSVCFEKTEEDPSERTVQHCSFQTVNQRMYHVAKKATYEALATSVSCVSKGGYQPPLTNLNKLTYITHYYNSEIYFTTTTNKLLDVHSAL